MKAVKAYGRNWHLISEKMGNRTKKACKDYSFKFIKKYQDNPSHN